MPPRPCSEPVGPLTIRFSAAAHVFGGTGFLGRQIVKHLLQNEFDIRAAARHPQRTSSRLNASTSGLTSLRADVHDDADSAGRPNPWKRRLFRSEPSWLQGALDACVNRI